jgi:hypothetical protein
MAKVKTLIDNLTGQTEARDRAKKEVTQMVQQANAKLDAMESRLRDMFRNKELESQMEIVGDRMGAFSREYRVNYSDGNMSKAVDELVESIMGLGQGDTRSLITRIISNSLNAMFTSVTTTEEEKRIFIVLLEGVALVRYDFDVWKSAEADTALFEHCQSVVAITYARSVVDHTKVSEDELNDAINRYLGGNVTVDDVIAYKKKLIELLHINANKANRLNLLNSTNDSGLISQMATIPLDKKKAAEFADEVKMTDESCYVADLLKSI